jgi:hypothetical protein
VVLKVDQKSLESFEMWCWSRIEKIHGTDRVRKEVLQGVKEGRNIPRTERRNVNWISYIYHRDFFLYHIIKRKTEGM